MHNTHHPIDTGAYYEDQLDAAKQYSAAFRSARLPKFFQHFERNIGSNGFLYSSGPCYVDLALWELIDGCRFAFPNLMKRLEPEYPKLVKLASTVESSPRIQACAFERPHYRPNVSQRADIASHILHRSRE